MGRLSTDQFIEKARLVHGDRYDYSLVNYQHSTIPVKIICRQHGEFENKPSQHLIGIGCQKCGRIKAAEVAAASAKRKALNTEEFIRRARLVHGDRYDYSLVEYRDYHSSVKIICPEHGEFNQAASHHLSGKSCRLCGFQSTAEKKRLTTEEFIEKAREIHGNKYDYSQVNYQKATISVKIICPEHGEFSQAASDHLSGRGCYYCGKKSCAKFLTRTTEEFIEKASAIHGDRFDYSLVDYQHNGIPVKIRCVKHDLVFEQTPHEHLDTKYCCPKCYRENTTGEKSCHWISDRNKARDRKLMSKLAGGLLRNMLRRINQSKHYPTAELLGYSSETLYDHLKSHPNWQPDWSLENYRKWHIDHIFPIKAFIDYGITDISDVRLINSLDNLRPLSIFDNLSKGDNYDPVEFEKWLEKKRENNWEKNPPQY